MSYILIVDDCCILRQLFSELLASIGLSSGEAEDGIEALESIRKRMPDLVILDVDMPGMDGREVLKRLKSDPITRDLQVILCTGRREAAFPHWAKQLGAIACLQKPCHGDSLLQLVQQVLEEHGKQACGT